MAAVFPAGAAAVVVGLAVEPVCFVVEVGDLLLESFELVVVDEVGGGVAGFVDALLGVGKLPRFDLL